MKTYILFWNPEENWFNLSEIAYRIQDGMCGGFSYIRNWELVNNLDIKKGDRFFILCTKTRMPKGDPIYNYLKSSPMCGWGFGPRATKFYNCEDKIWGLIVLNNGQEIGTFDLEILIQKGREKLVLFMFLSSFRAE